MKLFIEVKIYFYKVCPVDQMRSEHWYEFVGSKKVVDRTSENHLSNLYMEDPVD